MHIPDQDRPEKALRNILLGVTDDQMNSGSPGSLAVVSCHTGGGKTNAWYQEMAWMAANMSEDQRPKCVYAVPDKKNIPEDELEKAYKDYGVGEKFTDEVVVVRSIYDNFVEMVSQKKLAENLNRFFDENRDQALNQFIDFVKQAEDAYAAGSPDVANMFLRAILVTNTEVHESKAFRPKLSKELQKKFYDENPLMNAKPVPAKGEKSEKNKKDLEDYYNRLDSFIERKYPWVNDLYPARRARKAKIVMMTTALLNRRAVLVIEPSKTWLDYLNGDHMLQVTLDESDRAKNAIKDICLDESKRTYNIVMTYHRILEAAETAIDKDTGVSGAETRGGLTHAEWTKLSKNRPIFKTVDGIEIELSVKHLFDPTLDTNGSFLFKSNTENITGSASDKNFRKALAKKNFPNHYEIRKYKKKKKKDSEQKPDEENIADENINPDENEELDDNAELEEIVVCERDGRKYVLRVSDILNQITSFIRYFSSMLAHSIRKRKDTSTPYLSSELEHKIMSALSEINFDLEDPIGGFLLEQVKEILYPYISNRSNLDSPHYYNRGMSYFSAENSEDHELITAYSIHRMNRTPEGIIANMCGNAHVILLSATANSSSVLSNFDLMWLRANVPKVIRVREDLQKKYDDYYREYTGNGSGIRYHIINDDELIGEYFNSVGEGEDYREANLSAVRFLAKPGKEKELEKHLIMLTQGDGICGFHQVRMIKTLLALRLMLENEMVRYGVIFTNKSFSDSPYQSNYIGNILDYLEGYDKEIVHFLKSSAHYDDDVDAIKEDVSKKKKKDHCRSL